VPLSPFHPTVARWFTERIGVPSEPQSQGWPAIAAGHHTLIAAPTGTGKTLAAFLWAIDRLLRTGSTLPDETQVLFVSPLKALGNDVQKNLTRPLHALRAMDPSLPEVRVLVRSGDTPAAERTRMVKRPPHIVVTTPESLYILLTSEGGRSILRTVRTVIVDEIHAIAGDKRGSHLSLSPERLEALTAVPPQRIGLSATQKPVEDVARLLVGVDRPCEIVDVGHRRRLDLGIEIPETPLATVCSNDTWTEIVRRMTELIRAHRTTLVFVSTRKLAERLASRLTETLGEDQVRSHHGSLARERRLEAEERLKREASAPWSPRPRSSWASTSATWISSSRSAPRPRSPCSCSVSAGAATRSARRRRVDCFRSTRTISSARRHCSTRCVWASWIARRCRGSRSTSWRSKSSPRASASRGRKTCCSRRSGGRGRIAISRARTSTRSWRSIRTGATRCCIATV
jgi:hypothetical protein